MSVEVGEKLSARLTLSESEIAEFARLCRDANPLHYDRAYASGTRFGGIIACGPQYSSLLMGLVASHFSKASSMVGLEFTFFFRKPVHPGDTLDLGWEVVAVDPKPSLDGQIVSLEGKITNQEGVEVLGARGRILVTQHL